MDRIADHAVIGADRRLSEKSADVDNPELTGDPAALPPAFDETSEAELRKMLTGDTVEGASLLQPGKQHRHRWHEGPTAASVDGSLAAPYPLLHTCTYHYLDYSS